ncbi:hypothetical protein GCM10009592_14680 [Brachybacterium rhamnosum]|uniref:Phage tail tape measure protein domain-containing protein n=1 Tax=Brachybacterium rhamnosum TaxID=173361 RepID=A0ABW4PW47_9MICO
MALELGEITGFLDLDASKFQEGIGSALGALKSKDWKKFGLAAGAASAAALGVGFKGAVDLQSANAKTAAQLGLTKDEAAKVGTITGNLYSQNLGESMEDVSGGVAAVMGSFKDLRNGSQADIEAASKSALTFASVMDVDVAGAATTAGTLVQNGLAGDATEAFDLLAAAGQKVGPSMVEPLMDATNEYSKHFAMLGFDGQQAMTTLADAAAGGEISIDKAGDAVKEFGIRATDLGDTGAQEAMGKLGLSGKDMANDLLAGGDRAQEATGKITDALLGVKDPAEQAALAGALFGTQIEDMGKDQLPGFLTAMSGSSDSLGDVEGAVTSMGDTMSETGVAKLQAFGRGVQTELIDMMAGAVEWLTTAAGGLDGLVQYTGPVVIALGAIAGIIGAVNLAMTIWNGLLAIQKGAMAVATAAQWLWNAALNANPIGLIILGIGALVGALYLFFTKTETGRKIWETVWGAIKAAAAAVADWFTGTLLPILQAAWNGIAAGAIWLWQTVIQPAWQGIQAAAAATAEWIMGTLVPWLQTAWQTIATAAMWLYQSVILPVWNGIKTAIAVVVAVVMTYINLWVAIFQNVLAPIFVWLWQSIIVPAFQGIQAAIGAVVGWVTGTAVPFLQAAWQVIASTVTWLYQSVILPVWNAIQAAISAVVTWFQTTAVPFIQAAINVAKAAFQVLRDALAVIWGAIKSAIATVVDWFMTYVVGTYATAIGLVLQAFGLARDGLAAVWSFIRDSIIRPVVTWFQTTVVGAFRTAADAVKGVFQSVQDRLSTIWSAIRDNIVQPVVSWFQDTVVAKIRDVADKVKDAFTTMKDTVGKVWDEVKEKAAAPIRFVVDTVINKGIVSNFNSIAGKFGVSKLPEVSVGFAGGGVLPGYTPGRDVHSFFSPTFGRLNLSGGEAIMRPEFTRAVGGEAGVARLNMAARKGGLRSDAFASGGVFGTRSYAGGGVLGWLKGASDTVTGWVTDSAKFIADAVSDPAGVFSKLASGLLGGIPGGGLMTDIAKGIATKIGDGIGSFLAGRGETGGDTSPTATGTGGSLAEASRIAAKHGLTMTSGYRPGAVTSSGSPSMHGLGRARDYSNGSSPTPQMMAFAREILRTSNPTELLYTPLGASNVHRGGGRYANTGTVASLHRNHVHVAYKDGGVMDALGRGYATGTLNATPGWHMVGEQGPELLRFRGGEQVRTTPQTAQALGGGTLTLDEAALEQIATAVREGASQARIGLSSRDQANIYQGGKSAARSFGGVR